MVVLETLILDSSTWILCFGFLGLDSLFWIPGPFFDMLIDILLIFFDFSLISWVWIPGLDSWVWTPGFGFLGLDSWVWVPGFGFLGLESWAWIPGFGFLGLESWAWIPGFGLLA